MTLPSVPPSQTATRSRAALSGSLADPLSANIQGYSQEAVERAMRSGTAIWRPRFELYDSHRNRVLPDITTVTSATVSYDETREIKGSLDLTMLPDDRLRDAPFQWLIKPYAGIGPMPDGGIAEFPMGMFVWVRPKRSIFGITGMAEEWTAVLGDQTHFLQVDGPVGDPFIVSTGVPISAHIFWALYMAGFDAYGDEGLGIMDSDLLAAADSWYLMSSTAKQSPFLDRGWENSQPETWLAILEDLHGALGYQHPHFNKHGLYRACPDRAWSDEGPDVIYDTKDDGVALVPVDEEPDMEKIANRVVAYRDPRQGEPAGFSSYADLNWYVPQHPLAQVNTGRFITRSATPVTLPFASDDGAMYELAVRDLFERLCYYDKVTLRRIGFLAQHEANHIVGVEVSNDPHIGTPNQLYTYWNELVQPVSLYREQAWQTALFSGASESTLTRLLRTVP